MKGQIEYHVNDTCYILTEGNGLFANSNVLHSGYMKDGQDCEYLSVTFSPRFIYGYENSSLHTKYVDFITANPDWPSLELSSETGWQRRILRQIQHIYDMSKMPPPDYELQVHIALCFIWQHIYSYYSTVPADLRQTSEALERLKDILSYIRGHYNENISLGDIAHSVGICKSECCRFFKRHMHMTLFEYVLYYRIQQSLPLLRMGESVTRSASACGFANPCYYGKIFRRYMHCSPSQYRKARLDSTV